MAQKTFFYTDDKGVIREIDSESGEVIAKSPSFEDLAENHLAPLSLEDTVLSRKFRFNVPIAEYICQKVAEGMNLLAVTQMNGIPSYSIITRWRAEHPEFEHGLRMARKAKAERYEAMIEESLADDLTAGKDEIGGRQLWFKKMKFLASVHNPDVYGSKPETAKQQSGVTILIDTGIRKGDQPDAVDAECIKIEETKDGLEN